MREGSDKFRVGAFVLGGIILLAAGLAVLGGLRLFSRNIDYVLYFDGSVSGLTIGAPVVFRGVPLGRVTKISLVVTPREQDVAIPVYIRIDENSIEGLGGGPLTADMREEIVRRMVQRGLRARLQLQSLITGQYRVELDFFPGSPARYHSDNHAAEIPTVPSPLDAIQRTLTRLPLDAIATSLSSALQGIAALANSEDLRMAVRAARGTFENAEALLVELGPLREDVQRAVRSMDAASAALAARVPEAGDSFRAVAAAAEQLKSALVAVDAVVARDSRTMREFNQALKEIAEAARAVRALSSMLERHPESLLLGKGGKK